MEMVGALDFGNLGNELRGRRDQEAVQVKYQTICRSPPALGTEMHCESSRIDR